jgi:hypothetical protein
MYVFTAPNSWELVIIVPKNHPNLQMSDEDDFGFKQRKKKCKKNSGLVNTPIQVFTPRMEEVGRAY